MTFEIGSYTLDLSSEGTGALLGQSAAKSYLDFFTIYGYLLKRLWPLWIVMGLILAYVVFLMYQRNKFLADIEYSLFAVTVPPENEKTPKAMEQVINALWTLEDSPNFWEKWFLGEAPPTFSMEIVGINGYVRFLFRMPDTLRFIFESHIYAQYPDAEIQEVEDYVMAVPSQYPNDDYKLYGADIQFLREDAYPIRTYEHFEDRSAEGDYNYIDPLSAYVESLGALEEGDHLWLQMIIRPTSDGKMRDEGLKIVDEMMQRKKKKYEDIIGKYLIGALHTSVDTAGVGLGIPQEELVSDGDDGEERAELPHLSPGERDLLKALEENIGKLSYEVKMRMVYAAKKDVYNKKKFGSAFGGLLLFNTENLNGFKPNKKTKAKRDYAKWQVPRLQRKLVTNYKRRDIDAGMTPFHMSSTELATVFHFPYTTTQSPTLERAATRAARPPADLPMER